MAKRRGMGYYVIPMVAVIVANGSTIKDMDMALKLKKWELKNRGMGAAYTIMVILTLADGKMITHTVKAFFNGSLGEKLKGYGLTGRLKGKPI
jgi:hypothetical protein